VIGAGLGYRSVRHMSTDSHVQKKCGVSSWKEKSLHITHSLAESEEVY
jgi:hypothetical protein